MREIKLKFEKIREHFQKKIMKSSEKYVMKLWTKCNRRMKSKLQKYMTNISCARNVRKYGKKFREIRNSGFEEKGRVSECTGGPCEEKKSILTHTGARQTFRRPPARSPILMVLGLIKGFIGRIGSCLKSLRKFYYRMEKQWENVTEFLRLLCRNSGKFYGNFKENAG